MTARVDPDQLRAHAARASELAVTVEATGATGSDPMAMAVGHAELAAAIGDLRARSRAHADAVATQVEQAGTFLEDTAASWEALDEIIAGLGDALPWLVRP